MKPSITKPNMEGASLQFHASRFSFTIAAGNLFIQLEKRRKTHYCHPFIIFKRGIQPARQVDGIPKHARDEKITFSRALLLIPHVFLHLL